MNQPLARVPPKTVQSASMERRLWIAVVMLLTACTAKTQPPVFPPNVAGGWQLKGSQSFPAVSALELVRKIGTRGWWSAMYEGPGSATVELFELTSSAGGLQVVQEWRPVADAVVWYTPRYFIVVKWRSSDRSAVSAFVRAIEKQFAEDR
jgi:hypothetical protein